MPPDLRRAFTLIELLVVIAVIAVLVALLLPSLAGARQRAQVVLCGSRLKQLGAGLELYQGDFDRTLPQAHGRLPGGGEAIIGALFGGTRGTLPFYGIDEIGAAHRPLNPYVADVPREDVPDGPRFELEVFRSPLDAGAEETGVPIPGFERTGSMYDLIGSSYTLNDHAPDDNPLIERWRTLIPPEGGRMPAIVQPAETLAIATHTIYTFDDGADRQMRWFGRGETRANALMLDGHAIMGAPVRPGDPHQPHTTDEYTFLPRPDWTARYPWE